MSKSNLLKMKKDAMIAHWKRVKLEVIETGNFDNGFNVPFFGHSFSMNDKLNYCDGMIDQIEKDSDHEYFETKKMKKLDPAREVDRTKKQ